MKKLLFTLFLLVSVGTLSQNSAENEKLFSKNLNSFYKNPTQTLKVADYLFDNASNVKEKAQALYLISETKKLQGNYIESIDALFQAKALTRSTNNGFINTLISVSIADRCRISGMNDISNTYLKQAETFVNTIDKQADKKIATVYLLHEQAEATYQTNELKKAIELAEKAKSLIKSIEKPDSSLVVINAILLGKLYVEQGELEKASSYYENALAVLKESNLLNSSLEAETLYGLATIAYAENDLEVSEKNLTKAVSIAVVEKPLKLKVLNQLSQIYKENDSALGFQERYKESSALNTSILASERKVRNTILSQIENEQESAFSTDQRRYYIVGAAIFLLLVLTLLGYYFYNKKLDRTYQQFEKIIKQLENKQKIEAPTTAQAEKEESKGIVIPKETEKAILKRLDDFEASTKYTNSNISLPVLAKQMQTNTKYISEIIHIHKNKNFNTYINELRINHIIQLMKEDKKYLNYKVSYLAEESGFSSHSAFTVVFKSITGITPKQFITFLKKDDKVAS